MQINLRKNLNNKFAVWRLISLIITSGIFIVFLISFYTIYLSVYLTLNEAGMVTALSTNMKLDVVDLPSYQKVISIIEEKKKVNNLEAPQRNVFYKEIKDEPKKNN